MANDEAGVSRRHVLQILAALGLSGPMALDAAAAARPVVSEAALKSAATLLDGSFDDKRLEVARQALQRNLDQLQVVRDLAIGDEIEPATVFLPRR